MREDDDLSIDVIISGTDIKIEATDSYSGDPRTTYWAYSAIATTVTQLT